MSTKRSLYCCANARVLGNIYCAAGYRLSKLEKGGQIHVRRLARGEPLTLNVCQDCPAYDEMGGRVEPEDRGWFKEKKEG